MDEIAILGPTQMDRATIAMARAFSPDPMFTWIFPDPEQRARSLRRTLRVPLEFGRRYGRVTHSHDGMAVAIWLPPGLTMTVGRMVRSGFLAAPFQVGFRPFARFMGALEIMERIHKKHVPEPHWCLAIVAVDPELQGRGLGSALVKEGLMQADQVNSPSYLETSDTRNLAFYERQGFVVVETATLGDGGPPAWAMRREPRGLR
jgi:GNAT superfamily N-acetyltransferase